MSFLEQIYPTLYTVRCPDMFKSFNTDASSGTRNESLLLLTWQIEFIIVDSSNHYVF